MFVIISMLTLIILYVVTWLMVTAITLDSKWERSKYENTWQHLKAAVLNSKWQQGVFFVLGFVIPLIVILLNFKWSD